MAQKKKPPREKIEEVAVAKAATFVGIGMSALAVVILVLIMPMLIFARDSRDLTAGIAGGVLVIAMLLAGVYLVFRENTPKPILRAFYYLMGGLSIVGGVGGLGYAIYQGVQGYDMQKGMLAFPVVLIGTGGYWIKQGLGVKKS